MGIEQPAEYFKIIPEFPQYKISNLGSVLSCKFKNKRIMKLGVMNNGYNFVILRKKNKAFNRLIHRLVLEAFVGPCPDGCEADHINRIRDDNRLENLRWVTPEENNKNRKKVLGVNNPNAKFSGKEINEIKTILKKEKPKKWRDFCNIALRFNTGGTVIKNIYLGKTYKEDNYGSRTTC